MRYLKLSFIILILVFLSACYSKPVVPLELDNETWLKNIIIRKDGDGLAFETQARAPAPASDAVA